MRGSLHSIIKQLYEPRLGIQFNPSTIKKRDISANLIEPKKEGIGGMRTFFLSHSFET